MDDIKYKPSRFEGGPNRVVALMASAKLRVGADALFDRQPDDGRVMVESYGYVPTWLSGSVEKVRTNVEGPEAGAVHRYEGTVSHTGKMKISRTLNLLRERMEAHIEGVTCLAPVAVDFGRNGLTEHLRTERRLRRLAEAEVRELRATMAAAPKRQLVQGQVARAAAAIATTGALEAIGWLIVERDGLPVATLLARLGGTRDALDAVSQLNVLGWLRQESDGNVRLTPTGRRVATEYGLSDGDVTGA